MRESTARIANQLKSRVAFCVPAWCDYTLSWLEKEIRTWICCFCSWSWHKTLVGFHQRFSRAPQKMEHKGTDPAYALAFKLDHSMFVVCWWPRSLLICWMCSSSSDYIQTPVCCIWMFGVVCGDLYYIIYVLWYLCISFYMRLDCIDHRYQISFIQVSVIMKPCQPEGDARSGCVVFPVQKVTVSTLLAQDCIFNDSSNFTKLQWMLLSLQVGSCLCKKWSNCRDLFGSFGPWNLPSSFPQSMGCRVWCTLSFWYSVLIV